MIDKCTYWLDEVTDGQDIKSLTKSLACRLFWDLPLTPPQLADFGVDSADHYRALYAVLWGDYGHDYEAGDPEIHQELLKRIVELDQALGNGPQLTALIAKYAPQYSGVTFKTTWDVIREAMEEIKARRHGR